MDIIEPIKTQAEKSLSLQIKGCPISQGRGDRALQYKGPFSIQRSQQIGKKTKDRSEMRITVSETASHTYNPYNQCQDQLRSKI